MRVHTWEDPEINQIGTLNQAKQNDWPKEISKKHASLNYPHKRFKLPQGYNSESICVFIRTYYIPFLLINTLLVSLLFVFVGFLSSKAEEPGPCH